ncbi:MAG: MBL fold metallo-hydrolase [Gudongella sp.]|jgi:phosphoribosyl 1,2-cyclic phosphodiesterase|nr:MBL fold metallo-hydrolase [Gudongella sp.]
MGIKFCSLSSGSSGNCQYVETDSVKLIIDAGFSGKRIEQLLKEIEVDPKTLDGILVTHEHIDHSKGVGVLSRRYNIPVYANEQTWKGMEPIIKQVRTDNEKVFKTNKNLEIKDVLIHPFNVSHDANEPVGYIIFSGKSKMSFLTDTGWVNDSVKKKIRNSNVFFIESNHDEKMLMEGTYPWPLKQRIMSSHGHLSNADAAAVLSDVLKGENELVLLAHLSQDNNLPELAYNTVRDSLVMEGYDVDTDLRLQLTKRDARTQIYIIE